MNAPLTLSIVLMKEVHKNGSLWVAQCLEYDVAAQGTTIQEAKEAFRRTFTAQLAVYLRHGENPLEMIPRAPHQYSNRTDSVTKV